MPADTTVEYTKQVKTLLAEAETLPEGQTKAALCEQAIAIADTHRDEPLGFDARMQAMFPLYHSGRTDSLLVHFAWNLAVLDRNPKMSVTSMLWRYRWVIDCLPGFPDVSLTRIHDAVADMTRRYTSNGHSPRPIHVLARRIARPLGDKALGAAEDAKIRNAPNDAMSDGSETERAFDIFYQVFLRNDEKVARLTEKFVESPKSDEHFRGLVMTDALDSLLRLGKTAVAAEYHKVGLRLVRKKQKRCGPYAEHVGYLATVGDLPAAVKLFEGEFEEAATTPAATTRFDYFLNGRLLCDRMAKAGHAHLPIRLPKAVEVPVVDNKVAVADLSLWLIEALIDLAHRLDTRNGNDTYTDRVNELGQVNELADRLSVTTAAIPAAAPVAEPPAPKAAKKGKEKNW